MISEAGVMSKPVSVGTPVGPIRPSRKQCCAGCGHSRPVQRFPFAFFQTFTGITRLVDVIVQQCRDHIVGRSNRMEIPRKMQVVFSIGNTCEYPPPAAPPFMPKHGPNDGSRKATTAFLPILFNPKASPIETVVLPIPAFVGVMAVTRIRLCCLIFSSSIRWIGILAMYLP